VSRYAVIFRAQIRNFDDAYSRTGEQMRKLAMEQYGCTEFTAVTEGEQEIAISYWQDLDQIKRWKQDALHLAAQERGRTDWYRSYQVEIVEIVRRYSGDI
jgi:heme-degrading monooxygenase HmoA